MFYAEVGGSGYLLPLSPPIQIFWKIVQLRGLLLMQQLRARSLVDSSEGDVVPRPSVTRKDLCRKV